MDTPVHIDTPLPFYLWPDPKFRIGQMVKVVAPHTYLPEGAVCQILVTGIPDIPNGDHLVSVSGYQGWWSEARFESIEHNPIPHQQPKTVAGGLRRVRAILDGTYGTAWAQKAFFKEANGVNCYCLVGACNTLPHPLYAEVRKAIRDELIAKEMSSICCGKPLLGEGAVYKFGVGLVVVAYWNDDPNRTLDEVLALLDGLIERKAKEPTK